VPTWLIVVLVVFALLVIGLFLLGLAGARRRDRDRDAGFTAELEKANAALAEARAQDRGWERAVLEAAARAAHERAHPGSDIRELHLLQVVDRPGTDSDQARFRVIDAHGEHDILLGRRGDSWSEVA
jgi:hypothetical protein